MMDREQVWPDRASPRYTPTRLIVHEDEAALYPKASQQRKWIKCCGCVTALVLIQVVVVIVLIFTVFRVKDPVIRMNKVTVTRLELINGTTTPKPGVNMSLVADVSVKNPNVASFKYSNTTTMLYYHGTVVGEAYGPPGKSKPRRTMRMNISVDIITERLMSSPYLNEDIKSNLLPMSSFSRIPGRVKMIFIKKHVVVTMNCSMTVNVSSQAIETQKCRRHVRL
ncbi:hypothetical protein MLD38_036361 [Melastoma candidum]|uniref:Uncharacterized protein n=1 Tax=Melastoma candidum TaxID=119954 RepID=A0ACB9LJV8_9MYRT|nr:hypothetical protein MLD38_036361 [Melastoma candidum]